MAHRIEIVVSHHLRLAAGTRCKVHQHSIIVLIDECRAHKFWGLLPFLFPVMETIFITQSNILLHGRTLRHGQLDLSDDIIIFCTDDGLNRGTSVTIHDIMLSQHVGSGNNDGSYLTECQHDNPPFIMTFQNQHYRVVLADA